MDHPGIRREAVQLAGGTVIQPGTDHEQKVALINRLVGRPGTVHAEHAQIIRVVSAGVANALEGNDPRQSRDFGKGPEKVLGSCQRHTATAVEQGPLGRSQHGQGRADLRAICWRCLGAGRGWSLNLGQQNVFGNINPHRPGAASLGQVDGFLQNARQVFGVVHQVAVFDDAQGHAKDVGFLKGVGTNQSGGDLPGDHQQGDGIHVGIGNASDQVGGAGAGGGNTNPQLATGPGITVCRQGAGLLVAAQHMLHTHVIHQRVVQGHDAATRIPENRADVMAVERCKNVL